MARADVTTRTSRRRTRSHGCIGRAQVREATLAYLGHVLLDNRHGLVANVCVTAATGTAEPDAAAWMVAASAPPSSTVGADKGVRHGMLRRRDPGRWR